MVINMNGNTKDTNYRYTMDEPVITIGGQGNGVYTMFHNIGNICKSMNHPVEVVMSYIAAITGSNYIAARNTITGAHTSGIIIPIILGYIKYLVMCPKCKIPETIPKINGTKKNAIIILCCSACKNETPIKIINKRIDKGVDIIIKYLKSGNDWTTSKGTMVRQSAVSTNAIDETDNYLLMFNKTMNEITGSDFNSLQLGFNSLDPMNKLIDSDFNSLEPMNKFIEPELNILEAMNKITESEFNPMDSEFNLFEPEFNPFELDFNLSEALTEITGSEFNPTNFN
jgi:translation initiation factor 2 beta subunit (eIF-2beta)/eIF-5